MYFKRGRTRPVDRMHPTAPFQIISQHLSECISEIDKVKYTAMGKSKRSSKSKGRSGSGPKQSKDQRNPGNNSSGSKRRRRRANPFGRGSSADDSQKPLDDAQFRTELRASSRSVREMDPDGNCLFRSISDQLYDDWGESHTEVRSKIIDYIEASPDDFKFFMYNDEDEDEDDNVDENFDDYVKCMREDAEW